MVFQSEMQMRFLSKAPRQNRRRGVQRDANLIQSRLFSRRVTQTDKTKAPKSHRAGLRYLSQGQFSGAGGWCHWLRRER